MEKELWILLSVLTVLMILGILLIVFSLKRKKKTPTDYYTFFIMGLIWLPFGIIIKNYAFMAMGFIFMIVGLVNKDKWKKNRRDWKKMDKQERKLMITIMIILGFLVLTGIVFFFLLNNGII